MYNHIPAAFKHFLKSCSHSNIMKAFTAKPLTYNISFSRGPRQQCNQGHKK